MTGDRNSQGEPVESDVHDVELAELVADYMDRLHEGERLRCEDVLREHPDLGQQIIDELRFYVELDWNGSSETPPLGTLGDYTLRRQIGRGGMGVVYEAWQESMDRVVALKVLPPGVAADNRAFHRFMREAKTAGQLHHQNVVSVYSTGVEEGTPWYSMEYVEGETLAQVVGKIKDAEPETDTPFGKKGSVVYFGKLAEAFADVADGLQHAHSKGVIHRDIKPSNLILDNEGRLRILDFGLARLEGQESLTISGDYVGTPLYMSPEQARRKSIPVDHRTDIYSLGATMYQALTGQPPFQGKDHNDTLSQIIERDPRPPRQCVQRIPGDLETIVLKCLRKDPGDRYGTAEALAQDLRRFVRGDPIEAKRETTLERFARIGRRHGRRAAISVVVLGLVAACVALFIEVERTHTEFEEHKETAETRIADLSNRPTKVSWLGGKQPVRKALSACITSDGRTVFFDGHGQGWESNDIWRARRANVFEPFGEATVVWQPISSDSIEAFPSLSGDERWLYFCSLRSGEGALYAAESTDWTDPDTAIERVVPVRVPGIGEIWLGACASHDGRELFFVSDDPEGLESLWVADFLDAGNPEGGFSRPRLLSHLNDTSEIMRPSISPDGTYLLFSDRPEGWAHGLPPRRGGTGKSDLWITVRRANSDGSFGEWDEPRNLHALNGEGSDYSPWLYSDPPRVIYSKAGTLWDARFVRDGCTEPPVRVVRTIHSEERVRVNHRLHPGWTEGRTYEVALRLVDRRAASESCRAPEEVTIVERTPPNWIVSDASACGELDEDGVRWTLREGDCGASGFPRELSYRVTAIGVARPAEFRGTVVEANYPASSVVEGDDELLARSDHSPDGCIARWLLLGPYEVPSSAGPGVPTPPDVIRRDYLTDGGSVTESTVLPRPGLQVSTDFEVAASVRLAPTSTHVEIYPGGKPTWCEWFTGDDVGEVRFDAYYGEVSGQLPVRVVMYAAVYLRVEETRKVRIRIASDDSIQVLLDGEEIWLNSVLGETYHRRRFRDVVPESTEDPNAHLLLAGGPHRLLVKVFDAKGKHAFRLRLEDAQTGEALDGKLGVKVCIDPEECGIPP